MGSFLSLICKFAYMRSISDMCISQAIVNNNSPNIKAKAEITANTPALCRKIILDG